MNVGTRHGWAALLVAGCTPDPPPGVSPAGGPPVEARAAGATARVTIAPVVAGAGWSARSGQAAAGLGGSVASAGDVNGDGYGDLVVGASRFDDGETNEGAAFLYLGSSAGLSTTASFTVTSDQSAAQLGAAVASAGDVDGDGFDDLLIGAPGWSDGEDGEGAALLYLGSPTGPGAAAVWSVTSDRPSAGLGAAVAPAGDVDGDGFDDVVIGAPGFADGEVGEGAAFVYLGSPSGLGATPAWTAQGDRERAHLGAAVAAAGDVDGDGYDDLLVGAWGYEGGGAAFLYLGSPSGLDPTPAWIGRPGAGSGYFGTSVAGAGDVDGDGYDDLVIGAPNRQQGQTWTGEATLYLGSPSGPGVSPAWTATADPPGAFGSSVASTGDVNADGYDDVVIGAPEDSTLALNAGAVRIYLGSPTGLQLTPFLSTGIASSNADSGRSVASAGDVDGDGYDDVVFGAPGYSDSANAEGGAFVFRGLPLGDADRDGVVDAQDLCADSADPAQRDLDGDGVGDACDAPELELVGTLAPGAPARLVARGVAPGERVRFGGAVGPPSEGPCRGRGVCLDLGVAPIELGAGLADATGVVVLPLTVPAALVPGGTYTVQAVVLRGADSEKSLPRTIDGSLLDWDADGLTDAVEQALGTDPALADTDGDGLGDADEGSAGLDPLDPDTDADGAADGADRCVAGDDRLDPDRDRVPDACDDCPGDFDPLQPDLDGDGLGDACDLGFAPVVTDLRMIPAAPFAGETPRCGYTFADADGDPDRSTVTWELDGVVVGAGPTCPVALGAGETLTCTLGPSDGVDTAPDQRVTVVVGDRPRAGNVLVVIADDLGADNLAIYGTGAAAPSTPRIDALADEGVLFRRAYANPVCSPSRAAIQTGRRAIDTGVTAALSMAEEVSLELAEVTLPEMLAAGTGGAYTSSFVGKWHLGSIAQEVWDQPNLQGYDWYSGSLGGFGSDAALDELSQSYWNWEKTTNGVTARTNRYATTDVADDAIARLAVMPEPWLLVLAFPAPHAPLHWPPADLYTTATGATEDLRRYHAMIEAMDTELGRVLDALAPGQRASTTVIVTGDNGPWEEVIAPPLPADRGKGTLYEGGTHVPLIVTGPWVDLAGSRSDAVVQLEDVYATVAELAGIGAPLGGDDSVSFLGSLRDPEAPSGRVHVYEELFLPAGFPPYTSGRHAVTDGRWKLIEYLYGPDELYDLAGLDREGTDLLTGPLDAEQQAAYAALAAALPERLP